MRPLDGIEKRDERLDRSTRFSVAPSDEEGVPRTETSRIDPLNRSGRCESALIFPGKIVSRLTSAATRFVGRVSV